MAKMNYLIVLVTLCITVARQSRASGVFEFQLLDLERLDQPPVLKGIQQQDRPQVLLHICLREAFAVKSNGPCPYGNTTLLLSQESSLPTAASNRTLPADIENYKSTSGQRDGSHQGDLAAWDTTTNNSDDNEQRRGQGSQMTNLVRMPFTFKWTKAFTIILTAEQVNGGGQPRTTTQMPVGESLEATNQTSELEQLSRSPSVNGTVEVRAENEAGPANQRPIPSGGGGGGGGAGSKSSIPLSGAPSAWPGAGVQIEEFAFAENHVLPNGGARSGKVYTQRQSRTPKMAIKFNYRVSCARQYYGDSCTTFCKPRDDQFGHYECSPAGQRVCSEGWLGKDCNVPRCRPGCNQQHGFCDRPDTCSCRSGWTGPRCDECIAYPGCQNGYCLAPWQCECHKNWGGVLCDQDLNYCASHDPCLNNGTCENVAPARYKCRCPEGFTGANCELKLTPSAELSSASSSLTRLSAGSLLNPCLNGGACSFELHQVAAAADSQASSVNNLTSPASEQQQQQQQPLKVVVSEPRCSCRCPAGWTGEFCQWPEASETQLLFKTQGLLVQSINMTSMLADEQLVPSTGAYFDYDPGRHSQAADAGSQQAIPTITLEPIPQQNQRAAQHQQLEMRHLISGVVVASALGVFCASLMLAWCCLVAVEKGRFHFIQMNIIRQTSSRGDSHQDAESMSSSNGGVSSTLRRVQAKIRDSFKRRTTRVGGHIKPETKLSLENVFNAPKMPPPSYEESGQCFYSSKSATAVDLSESPYSSGRPQRQMSSGEFVPLQVPIHEEILVKKRGALEMEIALKKNSSTQQQQQQHQQHHQQHQQHQHQQQKPPSLSSGQVAQMHCPKHGHLYRNHSKSSHQNAVTSPTTVVEIEYQQPMSTSSPGRHKAQELRC